MIVGTEFRRTHQEMLEPMIGRLVEVKNVEGEKVPVLARIYKVDEEGVVLKAVSLTTRE